jgi:HD-GYP domain-containing protein (c-di-GMP phosphodiesterase class II)
MLEKLIKEIHKESKKMKNEILTEQKFMDTILNNIYQFFYRGGYPVHTIGIGILRGNIFDIYYRGRLIKKYTEMFGAMSYDATIAGRACELYKNKNQQYLHLFSKKRILEEFEIASKELNEKGFEEEAEAMIKRARVTIDQGVRSYLLLPISYGNKIIGIFTISSLKEYNETKTMECNIENDFIPLAQMLGLILQIEKISYDKAEEMGRLLISSIDAKDEYQASHSLDVRTTIDMFIDELSRDKELRERIEDIGFKLTVERILKLRFAALLHDIGKIFVPSSILRKYGLSEEEILIRKMHPYSTYNILTQSKTLRDIADIASMHHTRYFIPIEKLEKNIVGYPFDRMGHDKFSPESQIIALADTLNSIIRARPDREGLNLTEGLKIIENLENKFHEGLKDIFLTIIRRVEQNIEQEKYPPAQASIYSQCLWLERKDKKIIKKDKQFGDLYKFLEKIKFNTIGIISLMDCKNSKIKNDEKIKIKNKPVFLKKINDKHVLLSIKDISKEEGFIWIKEILNFLKSRKCGNKLSLAFVGKSGFATELNDIYSSLERGLSEIKNEPVHYYLDPVMYKCV